MQGEKKYVSDLKKDIFNLRICKKFCVNDLLDIVKVY